jgi:hypothetical protein
MKKLEWLDKTCDDVKEDPESGGRKDDEGKTHYAFLEPEFLAGVAQVLTFGAKKYGAYNYQKGIEFERSYSAMMRHIEAYRMGEEMDPETGLCHLYHAAINIMFIDYFRRKGK